MWLVEFDRLKYYRPVEKIVTLAPNKLFGLYCQGLWLQDGSKYLLVILKLKFVL